MRDGGKLGGKIAGRGRPKENRHEKNFTHPYEERAPRVRDIRGSSIRSLDEGVK
jgi:hypothetical protein